MDSSERFTGNYLKKIVILSLSKIRGVMVDYCKLYVFCVYDRRGVTSTSTFVDGEYGWPIQMNRLLCSGSVQNRKCCIFCSYFKKYTVTFQTMGEYYSWLVVGTLHIDLLLVQVVDEDPKSASAALWTRLGTDDFDLTTSEREIIKQFLDEYPDEEQINPATNTMILIQNVYIFMVSDTYILMCSCKSIYKICSMRMDANYSDNDTWYNSFSFWLLSKLRQ